MPRQFDDVMLGSIELFCVSAERESFKAAAATMGLTPAAVSRSIARLEARLGVRLFVRSTRQIRLTDSGRAYFERCRQALDELRDAERELSGQQDLPSGTVRISMATPFAHARVLPLVPAFQARYPQIRIEAHLSNRNIDFVAEGYDLAIRCRTPPDSGLIARTLEDAELVVVATPAYLAHAGTPDTPDDLATHDCIQFILPSSGQRIPWMFRDGPREVDLLTDGKVHCTDDPLGGVTLVRHDGGLLQTYRFLVDDDVRRGQLREVLQRYRGRSRPFSLLYPMSRHMPLRVRVLVDFLIEQLRPAGGGM
ncbi:MAG: LysR family transcriptional regulator [Tahibacter sp.]